MSLFISAFYLLLTFFLIPPASSKRFATPRVKSEIPDNLLFLEDVKSFNCDGDPFKDSILSGGIFSSEYYNQAKISGQTIISVEYYDMTQDDDQKESYQIFYGPGIMTSGNPFSKVEDQTRYIWHNVDISIALPSLKSLDTDSSDLMVSDFFITFYFTTPTLDISEEIELNEGNYVSMLQNVVVFNPITNTGYDYYLKDLYFQAFTYRTKAELNTWSIEKGNYFDYVPYEYKNHMPFLGYLYGNSILNSMRTSNFIYVFWDPMEVLTNSTSDGDEVSCLATNVEIVGCRAIKRKYFSDFENEWGETTHHNGGLMQNGIEIELSGSYTSSEKFWSITFPFKLPSGVQENPKEVHPNIALASTQGKPDYYFGKGSETSVVPGAESNYFFIDNEYLNDRGAKFHFNRYPKKFEGYNFDSDCYYRDLTLTEYFCPFQILSDEDGSFNYYSDGKDEFIDFSSIKRNNYGNELANSSNVTIEENAVTEYQQGKTTSLKMDFLCGDPVCDDFYDSSEMEEFQNTNTLFLVCMSHDFRDLEAEDGITSLYYRDNEAVDLDCFEGLNFAKGNQMHYCAMCEYEGGSTLSGSIEMNDISPDPKNAQQFTQFLYAGIFSRTGRLGNFYWLEEIDFSKSNAEYTVYSFTDILYREEYPQMMELEMFLNGPAKPNQEFHWVFLRETSSSTAEIEHNGYYSDSPSTDCQITSLDDIDSLDEIGLYLLEDEGEVSTCSFYTQINSDSKFEVVIMPDAELRSSYLIFKLQGFSLRQRSFLKAREQYDILEYVILFSDDETIGAGIPDLVINFNTTQKFIEITKIEYDMYTQQVETDIHVTIDIEKTVCASESFVLYFSNFTLEVEPSGCFVFDAETGEFSSFWDKCSVEDFEIHFAPNLEGFECLESPILTIDIHDVLMPQYISAYSYIQVLHYYNYGNQGMESNKKTMPQVQFIEDPEEYLNLTSSLLYDVTGLFTELKLKGKIVGGGGFQEDEKLVVRLSGELNGIIENSEIDCLLNDVNYPCRIHARNEMIVEGFDSLGLSSSFTLTLLGLPLPEGIYSGTVWLGIHKESLGEYFRLFNETTISMSDSKDQIDPIYIMNVSKSDYTPKTTTNLYFAIIPQGFIGKESEVIIRFLDVPSLLFTTADLGVSISSYSSGKTVSKSFSIRARTLAIALSANLEQGEIYSVAIYGFQNTDTIICSQYLFSLTVVSGGVITAQGPLSFAQFLDYNVKEDITRASLTFPEMFSLKKRVKNPVEVELIQSFSLIAYKTITPNIFFEPFSLLGLEASLPEPFSQYIGGSTAKVLISVVESTTPNGFYEMAIKPKNSFQEVPNFERTEVREVEIYNENITMTLNDGFFFTNPGFVSRPIRICLDDMATEDVLITFEILVVDSDSHPLFYLSEDSITLGNLKTCDFIHLDGTDYTVAKGRSAQLKVIPDKPYISEGLLDLNCLSIESSSVDYSLETKDLSSHSVTIELEPGQQGNYYLYLAPDGIFDSRVSSSFEQLMKFYRKEQFQLADEIIMEYGLSERAGTITFEIQNQLLAQTDYTFVIIGLLSGLDDLVVSGEFSTPANLIAEEYPKALTLSIKGQPSVAINDTMILDAICPLAFTFFIHPEDIGTLGGLSCVRYFESLGNNTSISSGRMRLMESGGDGFSDAFSDSFSDAFSDAFSDRPLDPVDINVLFTNSRRTNRVSAIDKIQDLGIEDAYNLVYNSLVDYIPDIEISLSEDPFKISSVEFESYFEIETGSTSITASGLKLNGTGTLCYALFQGNVEASKRLVMEDALGVTGETLLYSTGNSGCLYFDSDEIEVAISDLYPEISYTFAYFGKSSDYRLAGQTTDLVSTLLVTLKVEEEEDTEEEFGPRLFWVPIPTLMLLFVLLR